MSVRQLFSFIMLLAGLEDEMSDRFECHPRKA